MTGIYNIGSNKYENFYLLLSAPKNCSLIEYSNRFKTEFKVSFFLSSSCSLEFKLDNLISSLVSNQTNESADNLW